MNTYNVIKKIMESSKLSETDKVYYIKMYLRGWFTTDELRWIWKE